MDNLNLSSIEEIGKFISVTLPSSRKKKNTEQNIINIFNNNLAIKSLYNDRLNQSFNTIAIGLTYF